ncbi:MAG: hypothetical protein Q9175_003255 [Cornicularia normoerica]
MVVPPIKTGLSRSFETTLRHRLYDQLDVVDDDNDKNAKEGKTELALNRDAFRGMTKNLHMILQDADVLVSSAEMGTLVVKRRAAAPAYLKSMSDSSSQQGYDQVEDMLGHLKHSLQSRLKVAERLTQPDSETNISIARATKDDSSAMKIIAASTMIFLPATAVSGLCGMVFFHNQNGEVVVTQDWWLFIATTGPITIILIVIWWICTQSSSEDSKPLDDWR